MQDCSENKKFQKEHTAVVLPISLLPHLFSKNVTIHISKIKYVLIK